VRKAKWIAAGLAVLLVGLTTHGIWRSRLRGQFYGAMDELERAGEPMSFEAFVVAVPDERNAALDFGQAADQLKGLDAEAVKALDKQPRELAPPLTDKERDLLRRVYSTPQAAAVLAAVVSGADKPEASWPIDPQPNESLLVTSRPHLSRQRELSDFLLRRAMFMHDAGDHAAAIRHAQQMLHVADAVDADGSFIGHLVAITIASYGALVVDHLVPDLAIGAGPREVPPKDVALLIEHLLDTKRLDAGFRRSLQFERFAQADTLAGIAEGRIGSAITPAGGANPSPSVALYFKAPMLHANGDAALDYMTVLVRSADTLSDLPSWRKHRGTAKRAKELEDGSRSYKIAGMVVASFNRAFDTHFMIVCERRLAAAALAARWYACEHDGRLPERLDDLVPQYLPAIPKDAMTEGLSVRYDPRDPDPRLWTVFKNERDDGGKDTVPTESAFWNDENTDKVVHLRRQPRPEPSRDELDSTASEPTSQPEAQ
jgi:hypothetical protein